MVVIAMEAVIERQDVTVQAPTVPVKHLFCKCQRENPGGHRFALCGVELSGKGTSWPSKLIDLCVLCQDQRLDLVPCKRCGEPS